MSDMPLNHNLVTLHSFTVPLCHLPMSSKVLFGLGQLAVASKCNFNRRFLIHFNLFAWKILVWGSKNLRSSYALGQVWKNLNVKPNWAFIFWLRYLCTYDCEPLKIMTFWVWMVIVNQQNLLMTYMISVEYKCWCKILRHVHCLSESHPAIMFHCRISSHNMSENVVNTSLLYGQIPSVS